VWEREKGKQEVKRKRDQKIKRLRAGERGDNKERRWCLCSFQGLKGETQGRIKDPHQPEAWRREGTHAHRDQMTVHA
jgi:hypothetical protein